MKPTLLKNLFRLTLALALASALPAADRIELADGSVVYGKLIGAEAGKFKVETAFAGTIEIAQDKIRSFTTDEAVNVQLATGSTVLGQVQVSPAGIAVVAKDGQVTADPAKVAAIWRAGVDSPETRQLKERAVKAERKWAYEASVAINGRTGGSERFAGALGLKATLESAQDKLIFVLQAEKARDNGVETANRQFAGADYSSFFDEKDVWYARTSIEKDKIKDLDLRSTTAFGVGRKLIKKKLQDLELRAGVSYIYENYANGTKFDSPGLDLALIHGYTFHNGRLNNLLGYTPAFKNFSNYRVHHETTYEMPITASLWKLKTGISNDYTSIPQPGIKRLDTLYFTSLILNWK
ncbi:DUF481 domain-containing protein [Opitutus sp. GAS368]|jgi:hypothetical protein|uniref:DUF481 domain-containing protein n=1 Tax=Opitutus sp. GAS368 TaxID=1882749 RepID=UPI00087CABA2|nr:DUF481 domain-containing protein [Opitutus sp. GAS368]SDR80603.1 Protein of unknown function, DUF481 [Opitutus sp. GAS368]